MESIKGFQNRRNVPIRIYVAKACSCHGLDGSPAMLQLTSVIATANVEGSQRKEV